MIAVYLKMHCYGLIFQSWGANVTKKSILAFLCISKLCNWTLKWPKFYSGYQSHAKKKSRQCKVLRNINHLCLLADCMQNLPENMKPCSGPLVEIIISVSACAASSLSTSLKSINENVCRVFQRSFACMNDFESKHIYTQTNYFCTYFSWGYGLNNTSFCIFFILITWL